MKTRDKVASPYTANTFVATHAITFDGVDYWLVCCPKDAVPGSAVQYRPQPVSCLLCIAETL